MKICWAYGAALFTEGLDLKALAAQVREHSETQTVQFCMREKCADPANCEAHIHSALL